MSFPAGPFHVYIVPPSIDGPGPPKSIITFPSRGAVDEYWRYVLETEAAKPGDVRRTYYRHHSQHFNAPLPSAYLSVQGDPWLTRLRRACTSQSAKDFGALSFHDHRPDNKNGGAFYIRSAVRPDWFWYYNPAGKQVKISRTNQTKFILRRRNSLPFDCPPDEDILIGKDDINIFVFPCDWDEVGMPISSEAVGDVGEMIARGPQNTLVAASVMNPQTSDVRSNDVPEVVKNEAGTFKFEMFGGGFGIWAGAFAWENGQVYASPRVGGGERWEFVQ